ncbi:MAG TPA: hypothetical protein DCL40_05450 [Coxiellaceae bacterium]|nr:hypothetical protein [Coxiellaceae bacterium]|tara:strand:- start:2300 stop:2962 length:663 start_codon:yes stop_codon:yes gene_type:complete
MKMKSLLSVATCSILISGLSGCAAIGTKVAHNSLEVNTAMSKSIFLSGDHANKTVYLDIHNTTDKQIDLKPQIASNLTNKGYTVTNSPSNAHYVLQVNVLQFGKTSVTSAKEMTHSGYGGTAEGAVAGAAIASSRATAGHHNVAAGGLIGAAATTIVDNAVKDIIISGLTDVKITEHLSSGKNKVYTVRVATTAEKANLKYAAAKEPIESGLAKSISGIF